MPEEGGDDDTVRVWELKDEEGRTVAFEVSSLAGRRRVARIISRVSGVKILRTPKWFSLQRQDSFCEFELDGQRYDAVEPFGDNSRFLISRDGLGWHPRFGEVVRVFERAGLWFG